MLLTSIIDEAYGVIEPSYPGSKLYEVHTPIIDPIMSPDDIDNMDLVFYVPDNKTGTIPWETGALGSVQVVDMPWLQDEVIPSPINLDINDAVILMRDAGISAPFICMTLRKPLYPWGINEAFYIFGCPQISAHVFVGVDSHQVFQSNLSY